MSVLSGRHGYGNVHDNKELWGGNELLESVFGWCKGAEEGVL